MTFVLDVHTTCSSLQTKSGISITDFRKDNIVTAAVYSENPGKFAEECLQEVCDEMHDLIHLKVKKEQSTRPDNCVNQSDYHLIVYYTGHGKGAPKKSNEGILDGSWCATKKEGKPDWIKFNRINEIVNGIRICEGCIGSCT